MGQLRPQPRRVDARQARRAGTRGRVPGFAPEARMRIYERGIRRRLPAMLQSDQARIELAYSLLFTLPGTPALLWGEEIGLSETSSSMAGRRCERRCNGPTSATVVSRRHRQRVVSRVRDDGPFGHERVTVASQRHDPASLLNWMERMIRLRKECHEIGWGTPTGSATGEGCVFAHRYDWEGRLSCSPTTSPSSPRWSSCGAVSRTSCKTRTQNGEQVEPRERGLRSSSTPRDTGGSRSCSATGDGIER